MPSTLLSSTDDDETLAQNLEEGLLHEEEEEADDDGAVKPKAAKKRKRAAPAEETTTVTLTQPSVVISRKAVNRNVRRGADDLAQRRAMMSARAARLEIKFMRAKTEELHIERAQAVLVRAP